MIYTISFHPAIDRTILVDAISPPNVATIQDNNRQAAGKGINVSLALQELDIASTVVTMLAGEQGDFIRQSLFEANIPAMVHLTDGNTRENIKVIPLQGPVLECNDNGPMTTMEDVRVLLDLLYPQLQPGDIVVLTGSLPPGLPETTYFEVIMTLHAYDVTIVLDADHAALYHGIAAKPHIIKPNKYELEHYFNGSIDSIDDAIVYGRLLHQQGIPEVLITLGSEGSILITKQGTWIATSPALQVINTVGAGDTFVAGYLAALAKPPEERLRYAAAYASCAVLSAGTGPASTARLDSLFEQITITRYHQ